MDLLLLAKVLWRKKWILILIPVLAAVAAYLFTMDQIEYYRSITRISTGFTMVDQVQITDEKFNLRDADMKFSNLLQTMNEAIPANLVAYRLVLHDLESPEPFRQPANFNPSPEEVTRIKDFFKTKLKNFSPLSTSDPEYNLARKFLTAYGYSYTDIRHSMTISRVQNTDFVQIDFLSDNPKVSALAANAYCEEFIRYYKSVKSERTGESVEFLKQLMDDKKAALDQKVETQKVFKANNSVLDVQTEGTAKLGQLQEFERLRDESRSKVQKLELTIQRLNEEIRNAGGSVTTVNNQKIIDLRERITRLNERYITGGSSNHLLLDSLNKLREQLRLQMERANKQNSPTVPAVSISELQSKLKDAEIDLKVERSNLSSFENKIASIRYTVSGYANKEAALEAIQKEVDLASQEYLDAVNKYNDAQNRMIASTTLRQVLAAAPAAYPESSKRYLIIGLAGFSSLAICLFAIIGLELIDVSIRNPEKFKRLVGLPLIGMINKIDSKNFNIRAYFNQTTASDENEMYKSLLRKLRHEIETANGKVILFTSPKKKDGKTFVMFSLAYVLSLINKRVLVIDTNFKNNSLSQILVKPQTEIKVLEGRRVNLLIGTGKKRKEDEQVPEPDNDAENTYDLINPTKYKNIFIVGNAGGGVESPAEILSGRDFTNLIAVLVDSFDYILMEGAALNDFSDTKELVQYADKVFAVFSADSSIKQLDKESISYFRSLGKKFGGAILNRISTKDLKL
jgi:succinoglycan biosynthesis transport protein ExoP